jgi:thiosulfate/3-mercaptopyruvate sulfurtransferase
MGIKNKDEIVIYDNSDVISSCRCWYNFIYFGHNPKLVHVLDGGLKKWKKENKLQIMKLLSINLQTIKLMKKKT